MPDPSSQVRELLEELVASTDEIGLQAAAYVDGQLVVDAWAGLADPGTARPVTGETLFLLSSCSKGVAATCLHLLVERGQLAYDDPICRYWPELAARGKAAASVRDALGHRDTTTYEVVQNSSA